MESENYKGLKQTLRVVRGVQNYAAVIAEVLILVAFAMSSLDVSIGGKLATIGGLAWVWAAVFALGIDTCFVLSWVRIRQVIATKRYGHLWYAIPLALGMSFIVFQPVAIQQLQQSLGISFSQALANLGVNLGFLVYARSFVAVFLGAILALTNSEGERSGGQAMISGGQAGDQVSGKVIRVRDVSDHSDQLKLPAGDRKEAIRSYMKQMSDQGDQVNATVIAALTNIPASTVRRYIRDIRSEEAVKQEGI